MGYLWNFRITSIVRVTGLRVIGLDKQSRTYSSAGNESKEETESCRDLVALGSRLKDAISHSFSKRTIDMTLYRKDVILKNEIRQETVTGLQNLWVKAMMQRASLKLRYAFVTVHVADVAILEKEKAVEILFRVAGMGFIRAAFVMGLRFRKSDLLVERGKLVDGKARFSVDSHGLVREILITSADITPLLKASPVLKATPSPH